MGVALNDNIRVEAGKPIDDRYLNGVVSYANVAEVNATLALSRRYLGLTVRVGTDEYHYKNSIADIDLILKTTAGGGGVWGGIIGTFTDQADAVAYIKGAKTYTGKQTFFADATNAGLTLGIHTADPSVPSIGDVYYNSTLDRPKIRATGAWRDFTLNDTALTSGRIPYTTTNGRLIDSSNLTWDGTDIGLALNKGIKLGPEFRIYSDFSGPILDSSGALFVNAIDGVWINETNNSPFYIGNWSSNKHFYYLQLDGLNGSETSVSTGSDDATKIARLWMYSNNLIGTYFYLKSENTTNGTIGQIEAFGNTGQVILWGDGGTGGEGTISLAVDGFSASRGVSLTSGGALNYDADYSATFGDLSMIHKGFANANYWKLYDTSTLTGPAFINGGYSLTLGAPGDTLGSMVFTSSSQTLFQTESAGEIKGAISTSALGLIVSSRGDSTDNTFQKYATTNNTVVSTLRLQRRITPSAPGVAGIGVRITFEAPNASSLLTGGIGQIDYVFTDVTNGSVDGEFRFNVGVANTPTNILTLKGNGAYYAADYSASYTSRSLVDKGYVDSVLGASGFWQTSGTTSITSAVDIQKSGSSDLKITLDHNIDAFRVVGGAATQPSSFSVGLGGVIECAVAATTGQNGYAAAPVGFQISVGDGFKFKTNRANTFFTYTDTKASKTGMQYAVTDGSYVTTDGSLTNRGYVLGSKTFAGAQTFKAGAAGVGLAPAYLQPGVALLTPADGALEYHGSHLWFTIGSTRYQLDQQSVGIPAYAQKIANYTLVSGDYIIHCTANSFTVTLPSAVTVGAGKMYVITNSGSGTITLATTISQTIDGSAPGSLGPGPTNIRVLSDGANWITW